MRGSRATILVQYDWDLSNPHPQKGALDDHLARELHSCGPEVHPLERRFAERAEPAVKVADLTVKEDSTDHRQQWITDPAVCPRHGPGHDATKESVPHDEVVPLAHLFDKRLDRR